MVGDLVNLNQRSILVTGASSGIGRDTAILLGRLGARVALVARSADRLQETLASLEGSGHAACPCDLGVFENIAPLVREAVTKVGPLSGIVHCAGIQLTRPLAMCTGEQIEQTLQLNVSAALGLAKAFTLPGMSQPGGSIVFMSSVMGLVGQPAQSLYSASKGALVALARSLALELARRNIRVNCVAAAVVQTGMGATLEKTLSPEQFARIVQMHPLGLGQGSDVASAIAFLLSDAARWITGSTLVVDGGYTAQ